MKKLISLVLSISLIVCMFAISVSANDVAAIDEVVFTNKVGSHGANADNASSYLDGIPGVDFNEKSFNHAVQLILGVSESRYAVDIEFSGNYYFNISGLTWDVNKLEYVTSNSNTVSTITENQEYGFKVINYSDNSIHIDASHVEGHDDVKNKTYLEIANLELTFAEDINCSNCDVNHSNCDFVPDSDGQNEANKICGVLAGNSAGDEAANWVQFTAHLFTVGNHTWAEAINTWIETYGATTLVLTQFTIVVSPTSGANFSH